MIRSSFAGFTTAQLGMSASNAALNVIGQNISNINVTGYTRQRVDLDSFNVTTGPRQWGSVNETFIGNGVVTNRIEQVRDPYLDLRFRTEMSSVGYYDKMLVSLEDLQSVLDEVDREGSIHNQLEAIFKALNEFNPQAANNEFQNMAKTEMQLLTQYFNNYSNRIQQAKDDNIKEFREQTIPELNQLLKDITNLNRSIKDNEILGNPALELRDERNLLLDELSQYVKIEVTYENKYLGLSDRTAEECTVKILGIDENGNNYKYTIIDDDKASQFQINEDCSNLTITDVNGNPVADIGSALKPTGGVEGTFTPADATAMSEFLEKIQELSNAVKDKMTKIDEQNKLISSLSSQKNNLVKQGNKLHEDLISALNSVKSINNVINNLQEQLDKMDADGVDKTSDKYKEVEASLASRQELLKKYNNKLFGQDTVPAGYPDDVTALNQLDPDGSGIYNKLIKIYGTITDAKSQPPKYTTDPNGQLAGGALIDKKNELATAKDDLEKMRADYSLTIKELKANIYGGKSPEVNLDGLDPADKTRLEAIDGLAKYANITVDWESYPVEGTDFFVSLPTITLTGTSARDGNGIPLFDADTGKIGNIASDGVDITITDTRGVEYTEKAANVDGDPYELDNNGNRVLDEYGNPILDMGDQRNMYKHLQEDSGSIKASLDMFNRAGEFNETSDRGYDYYLNMLDTFARQIAKVFNEANTMDKDGNPLVDENGKPLDYANALFGADGKAPIKNLTNTDGQYFDYNGAVTTTPLPDVFKTDANGYLLDANGEIQKDGNGKPLSIKNPANLNNALLDTTALASYGFVQSKTTYDIKDAAGNVIDTVNAGDWVDKDGNKLFNANSDDINNAANKTQILNGIATGTYETLAGKVPKIDYDQITAANFTITQDWVDSKTNFVQTHDPSQTAGYNDNINHLIAQFSEKLNYTFTLPDGTQQKVFNGTFLEFYDNIGNQLGLDIKSSTILENNYITIANDIANNRDAISGVSLDEEGIDILRYQKAYTASARLMTALDEQLDKVINNMGIVGR
ncbi:flagellar basal body rod C-terminal domain-containing protein [Clostridium sp. MD294]|uniref:FlgK family flagellar hook-associated protein n=1 Tax=Clostridium sp. MD294 TaxID=97138 RepID=UPI0002CA0147|nr:flagellar basal body rod C-terminal domain-containing protein [Clostridium sp. MD294]NDO46428.1 hypothetical protein [Clostridium sp. MD294]USF29142.1 hypothetical protein C820_000525 [Clostridium sp. MD294]